MLFIVVFSTSAIRDWPPFIEKLSIILACILPLAMVAIGQAYKIFNTKKVPKEIMWVLMVLALGLISSFVSENKWASLKSVVLFTVSGPLVFIVARYLLEPIRSREIFLWLISLSLLAIGILGIYEFNLHGKVILFSDNPLPTGALLLLCSACPMILLNRVGSLSEKTILTVGLVISIIVIVLLGKKSPILGVLTSFIFLVVVKELKYMKYVFGVILLGGVVLISSDQTILKYKKNLGIEVTEFAQSSDGRSENLLTQGSSSSENSDPKGLKRAKSIFLEYKNRVISDTSIYFRAESIFFGLHVFKKYPLWGVGFKANLDPHFDDYGITTSKGYQPKRKYRTFMRINKTFENIFVSYLVELGGIFFITYFGGVLYIVIGSVAKLKAICQQNAEDVFIVSVLVGFIAMSFTFDTLRFPSLNWVFHSLLGLMVNINSSKYEKNIQEHK